MKKVVLIALVFLMICSGHEVAAQYKTEREAKIPLEYFYIERKGPRKLLSRLTFGLSTGFAWTNFTHRLTGFDIWQSPDAAPLIFQDPNTSGYSNWFNQITTATLPAGGTLYDGDAGELGFRSRSFNIPLKATLHVEFGRYRIGGGYSFEYTRVADFEPLTRPGEINTFAPDISSFFLKKYFVLLGAAVYRYDAYLLIVDANVGGYKLGKKFDNSLIERGLFFNPGITIEREMSEYFRLFVRPSYDIKNFDLDVPETGNAITHRMNAFYLNVGATYRIPELRRCFLKTCRGQHNHAHGNREYRSRVHPIYKKQNPHYGENYPVLIKYKGKNKKKLNPY